MTFRISFVSASKFAMYQKEEGKIKGSSTCAKIMHNGHSGPLRLIDSYFVSSLSSLHRTIVSSCNIRYEDVR